MRTSRSSPRPGSAPSGIVTDGHACDRHPPSSPGGRRPSPSSSLASRAPPPRSKVMASRATPAPQSRAVTITTAGAPRPRWWSLIGEARRPGPNATRVRRAAGRRRRGGGLVIVVVVRLSASRRRPRLLRRRCAAAAATARVVVGGRRRRRVGHVRVGRRGHGRGRGRGRAAAVGARGRVPRGARARGHVQALPPRGELPRGYEPQTYAHTNASPTYVHTILARRWMGIVGRLERERRLRLREHHTGVRRHTRRPRHATSPPSGWSHLAGPTPPHPTIAIVPFLPSRHEVGASRELDLFGQWFWLRADDVGGSDDGGRGRLGGGDAGGDDGTPPGEPSAPPSHRRAWVPYSPAANWDLEVCVPLFVYVPLFLGLLARSVSRSLDRNAYRLVNS